MECIQTIVTAHIYYNPTFYRHNGEKCGPGLKPAGPLSIALSGARKAEGRRRRAGKPITSSLALSSLYCLVCPGLDVAFLDTSKFVLIETAVGDRDVSNWRSFLSTSSSSSSTASQLCTRFLWFDVSARGATPLWLCDKAWRMLFDVWVQTWCIL